MIPFIRGLSGVGRLIAGARIPVPGGDLAEIGYDPELKFDRWLRDVGFGHSGNS
jgi:hypothetical protein